MSIPECHQPYCDVFQGRAQEEKIGATGSAGRESGKVDMEQPEQPSE